jgi:FMN phosphatase YigB (HAD superfamily)
MTRLWFAFVLIIFCDKIFGRRFVRVVASAAADDAPSRFVVAAFTASRPSSLSISGSRFQARKPCRRTLSTGVYSSSSSLSSSSSESTEEDLKRWERLYNQGGMRTTMNRDNDDEDRLDSSATTSLLSTTTHHHHEIRVVTFDLDNTLWNTTATISLANDALAQYLEDELNHNVSQPVRVEKIMGQLFQKDKEKYGGGKAPVYLTKLRKDAIRHLLMEYNEYDDESATKVANAAFQVWMDARHTAISSHYATEVVSSLQRVKRTLTTASNKPILIGAVTDGNSDPRNIPELSELFDFCVNAETIGVSKPDKRLYLEALMKHVVFHPHMNDVFPVEEEQSLSQEAAEDMIGPWWVHVGDDFVKDIVASKSLKMRTVWSRELVLFKESSSGSTQTNNNKPTKTVEQFVKQMSEMKVVEMGIGSDEYLVDSLHSEFADAIVDSFDQVHNVLMDWQAKAHELRQGDEAEDVESSILHPSVVDDVPSESVSQSNGESDTSPSCDTKFCIYCGVKLPTVAKFCSSCGEKQ